MNDATTAQPTRARWTTFASVGFAMAAVGDAILVIVVLAWGLDIADEIAFFLVPIVVTALLSFLVYRFGTWAKIVGLALSVLGAFGFWWLVFGLFLPGSFFDFVPGVLFLPGLVIGLSGCIASLVASRRGHVGTSPTAGERQALRTVAAAVAVLVVLSGVLTLVQKTTADASRAGAIIVMADFEFRPKFPQLAAGSTILVRNDDPFWHTFSIDALNINVQLNPGSSELVTLPATAGTHYFYCEPHGSDDPEETKKDPDDMSGTLTLTLT